MPYQYPQVKAISNADSCVNGHSGYRNGHRPTIGITAGMETAKYGVWNQRTALLSFNYIAAVQRAGGRAVILAPDEQDIDSPASALNNVDGLILSGGAADIHPKYYGVTDNHDATNSVDPLRDEYELALARTAVKMDLPILGICRGMQVINVAYGGKLEQHLPDSVGHEVHRAVPGEFSDHEVKLASGSLAQEVIGSEVTAVKSHHHQGVAEPGAGLKPTGWATLDETIEALEDPKKSFVLGVLWHPEEDSESRIISRLVDRAAARKGAASNGNGGGHHGASSGGSSNRLGDDLFTY